VWEAVYLQHLMGVNGVIVDLVEEISNAVAEFSKPSLSQSTFSNSSGIGMHEAFSQQQLGFLLRLIPELIQQPH
jgi:glycerophosphodiester phosphodiesterase